MPDFRKVIFLLLSFSFVSAKVLDVPFVKQQSGFCGPAALSSVFKYYGKDISQEDIGKRVYIPKLKGALITDLENFAKKEGFKTILKKGSIQDIKKAVDKGKPVIVLVDMGIFFVSKLHYLVVVGYNEKGLIAHTGYKKNQLFEYREFKKIWNKAGNILLIVYPYSLF